jgi:LuxR family maltose regulon positive regulatory protein
MFAGALTTAGQTTHVEEKLRAAENALKDVELDVQTRDLIGRIASNRATLAVTRYEADTAIVEAERAHEYLHPDNLPVRTITTWTLGVAYDLKGDRKAAGRAFTGAISASQAIGHTFVTKLATIGLGGIQRSENRLYQAAETYRRALQLFGDQPLPIACEAHVGLARIFYEWNDLDAAQRHGEQSIQLARQFADIIDRFVICEVFLSRLTLTKGDAAGAAAILARIGQIVRQHNFVYRMPEVAAAQVLTMLHQGNLAEADRLAHTHELPLSQARVHLARGDTSAAVKALEPYRRQVEAKGWEDERLKVMVLQTVALYAHGTTDGAVQLLGDALALAEPGGFIRIFVDEGEPMARLLSEAVAHGFMPDYTGKLLAVFKAEKQKSEDRSYSPTAQPLIEPLSQRELEILQLIAEGLSNNEICQRLFLALPTVKGHNRNIFGKLQVQRRTEAVARARELGLL